MSPLTKELEGATEDALRRALRTPFAERLARGTLDRTGYVRWLTCLQALYAELEWALMWNRLHPVVGPLCLPELWRNELLQDDLRTLLGSSWYASTRRQDVERGVARLGLLCDEAPELLAAHAWVLYATPLAGAGQAGPSLARTLGLRGAAGTDFLRHATRLDGEAYRAHLLDTLDQLSPDARLRTALVQEATRVVHGLHVLLEGLSRGLPQPRESSRGRWFETLTPLRGALGA